MAYAPQSERVCDWLRQLLSKRTRHRQRSRQLMTQSAMDAKMKVGYGSSCSESRTVDLQAHQGAAEL